MFIQPFSFNDWHTVLFFRIKTICFHRFNLLIFFFQWHCSLCLHLHADIKSLLIAVDLRERNGNPAGRLRKGSICRRAVSFALLFLLRFASFSLRGLFLLPQRLTYPGKISAEIIFILQHLKNVTNHRKFGSHRRITRKEKNTENKNRRHSPKAGGHPFELSALFLCINFFHIFLYYPVQFLRHGYILKPHIHP